MQNLVLPRRVENNSHLENVNVVPFNATVESIILAKGSNTNYWLSRITKCTEKSIYIITFNFVVKLTKVFHQGVLKVLQASLYKIKFLYILMDHKAID